MKNSRSGRLKGCPLQLAPNPLERLLSETSWFQLDGPNSNPLQLEKDDSTSELKENELRPKELKAVSQLEEISPSAACQLANVSLVRPYEVTACCHFATISRIPACQLANASLVKP